MTIASNKYANKVYSEHPIALWPLDEQAYYLALADNNDRYFSNWTNGGTDRVNFITNPNFETNTTGWAAYASGTTIAKVTTDSYVGTSCLEVTRAAILNSGIQSSLFPVAPSQTYTASAYIKIPTGSTQGSLRINFQWYTSASVAIASSTPTSYSISNTNGWTRFSNTATVPSNAAFVSIFIVDTGTPTAGQKFLVDGVMFEASSSANSYFDGVTGGGAWIGAANASASVIHAKNRINKIFNPSFENGTFGYDTGVGLSTINTDSVFGSNCGLVTCTTSGNYFSAQQQFSVIPNKTYSGSAYVKVVTQPTGFSRFGINIVWFTANGGTYISETTTTVVSGSTWTRYSVTGTAPSNATWANLRVFIATDTASNLTGAGSYRVDGMLFEESSIAYPYFDGSFTSISYGGTAYTIAPTWSGTAHASTSVLTQFSTSNSPTVPTTSPFDSDIYSSFTKSNALAGMIDIQSADIFDATNIDATDSTFTINTFLYQNPTYINWFKIGYRTTVSGSSYEEISDAIPPPTATGWINLNETFTMPLSFSGGIKIFFQVNFKDSTAGDAASRTVIMNGLSVGQGSSLTCYESLGSTAVDLPTSLNIPTLKGISADQYGVLADNGYYLVRNNKLLAHNDGMSMIYGTDVCTKIEPSGTTLPSFIFPGKGMLHENGRNREFTFEMWMKLDPQTSSTYRIVGPLDSNDGVYVKEGFITLAINDEIGSHYVGEWYRPMLINVILKENNAVLLINGEQVINIPFDRTNAVLSTGRDWWGIFAKSSFSFFSIDCIAIYPYVVSEIVAKRRFVYGQGTPSMQLLDSAYSGNSTSIDFATSQYNTGVMYPDTHRWDAAYFNNLDVTRDYLSVPNYSLPIINIGGRDVQEWYDYNYTVNQYEYPTGGHPYFVTFRPNIGYKGVEYGFDEPTVTMDQADVIFDGVTAGTEYGWAPLNTLNYKDPSYFNFPSLNILNDKVVAMYAIFEAEDNIAEDRTLIRFSNTINGDIFDIYINSGSVYYSLNGNIVYNESIGLGLEFTVGLNFSDASFEFGYEVSKFFSSPSSIQVFVGGNGTNTFEGKIYNVAFCNQSNYDEISSNFYSIGSGKGGIIKSSYPNYQILTDHIASYTLIPEYDYGTLFLDISVSSQWEEFFPLSFFAGYIKDENGNNVYDLDMLQLNIGYSSIEDTSVWSYQGLKDEFSASNYLGLKTSQYSPSYFNLKKKNTTQTNINVGLSSLQGYLTFQKISDGANAPLSSFDYTKLIDPYHIIDVDGENTALIPDKAYKTKFSFVDNMIIFPPKAEDFNDYAMVVHLQIKQRAILKNPLKLRKFEISSKNFNYDSSNTNQKNIIGTKFGNDIYPRTDSVFYNLDKSYKPYFISKKTTPYLYNSKYSGINVINESILGSLPLNETKISIPVNKSGSSNYNVAAIQFMVKPNFDQDAETSKVMEIKYNGGTMVFALNKSLPSYAIESYLVSGNGIIVDGGTPSTTIYSNIFDNGVPSSTYTLSVDFNWTQQGTTSVTEFSYLSNSSMQFYQNGKYVSQPIFTNNEWTTIGIIFDTPLNFANYYDGEILLYGGGTFNNISYYLSEGLGIKTDINSRVWQNVLDANGVGTTLWSYWNGSSWQTVYILNQTASYIITPEDIYDAYTGTNGEIIDDEYGVMMHQGQAKIISSANWSIISGKPA